METFSIVKQFDEAKLREKIIYFVHENGYNPYIFANHGTLEVLKKPYAQDITFTRFDGKKTLYKDLICKYQGCKIFEDNTLEFGEIELR